MLSEYSRLLPMLRGCTNLGGEISQLSLESIERRKLYAPRHMSRLNKSSMKVSLNCVWNGGLMRTQPIKPVL